MIDNLLSRLDKVTGRNGSWTAKCPSHQDKSPSLAIADRDGVILLHCFAGCSAHEICSSIGLDVSDLFPDKQERKGPKPKFYAKDLLKIIHFEAVIAMTLALDVSRGKTISQEDLDRAWLAYERIDEALKFA